MTKQTKQHLKSLLPIIFSVLVIVLVVLMIPVAIVIRSFAQDDALPQNVIVSNVTPNSFSVTFITSKPVTGSVSYGEGEKMNLVAVDSVDLKPLYTHLVTVNYLQPSKTYNFVIRTDNLVSGNGGKPFNVTLPPLSKSAPATPKITYGKLPQTSTDFSDSIVILQAGKRFLATRPDSSGKYLFTYTNFVDANGDYARELPKDAKTIYFVGKTGPNEIGSSVSGPRPSVENLNTNQQNAVAPQPTKAQPTVVPQNQNLDNQNNSADRPADSVPVPVKDDFGVSASKIEPSIFERIAQFFGSIFSPTNPAE